MRAFLLAVCAAGISVGTIAASPSPSPQVAVEVGQAPDCPYGYYDVAPYSCAPAGYYGPEWFNDGVFIGVGPWFHGPENFHGMVDNRFHPEHGYHGALPERGEKADAAKRVDKEHFKGNETRDGKGHVVREHEKQ